MIQTPSRHHWVFTALSTILRWGSTSLTYFVIAASVAFAQHVSPVLEFPEVGLDDPAAYMGYQTRFFWDTEGNAFQTYLDDRSGRVVNLWANAANESASFTVRDSSGHSAYLSWDSRGAVAVRTPNGRSLDYGLSSEFSSLELGLFLLGSMRLERDFQYQQRHMEPFESKPFEEKELLELLSHIENLPDPERSQHLALLNARSLEELRSRLFPTLTMSRGDSLAGIHFDQKTFDGKNDLSLDIIVDSRQDSLQSFGNRVLVRSLHDKPIRLKVRVATNSPALTPLRRNQIFNEEFLNFYHLSKSKADSVRQRSTGRAEGREEKQPPPTFQWLDRDVRSTELLSYQEKLMAGLPNFATYFGRDMLMSALMMEPIWSPSMLEHVISSVLRKLTDSGEVSHEEALGGQAIRENAARYNGVMAEYGRQVEKQDRARADSALADARALLGDLQSVRENYNMVDDDFQLPVLVARYLSKPDVPAEHKREFLLGAVPGAHGASRVELIVLNLHYVSRMTRQYVSQPKAVHLVSFRKLGAHRWLSGSWRDSGPGYGGGRFAMDVNAIWAPKALESLRVILAVFDELGITTDTLETLSSEVRGTILGEYCRNPQSLERAISAWKGARRHFEVTLTPQQIQQKLQSKLRWLPLNERSFWEGVLARNDAAKQNLKYLALSLDEDGDPIPVVNTDPATLLFLEDLTDRILDGSVEEDQVLSLVRPFLLQYPVGLFVEGLGPLVANDAYASETVWENFAKDPYHSPRTVWGREVNLLLLGLAKQLSACYDDTGKLRNAGLESYAAELRSAFERVVRAVTASGLKHNELWSYRIEDGTLFPVRYGSSSDVQLWNVTDLAVQFLTSQIPSQ